MAAMYTAFAPGCGDTVEIIGDTSDGDTDGDTDGDADGDTDSDADSDINLDDCDAAKTCAGKIAAGNPEECIADFGLGTNQAGYPPDGYSTYVGLYAYNDLTSTMLPVPNYFASEPAEEITSCDTGNNFALHFVADAFTGWGAGVGMNWGGPANANCKDPDPCLQLRIDDDHYTLADAQADTTACPDEAAIDCFKYGKNVYEAKDLSAYAGIGFWTLSSPTNTTGTLKVTFPIPATMRFYSEKYDSTFGYGGVTCDEEDDDAGNNCYNDYYTTVSLAIAPTNPTAEDKTNKWIYQEILFDDIAYNPWWGLQLEDIAASYAAFPKTQSMGIKFQIDASAEANMTYTDFYIDDITLIK
jgi:hypothetical protein